MSESQPTGSGSGLMSNSGGSGTAPKNRIYLVSYPKVIFMYPTAVTALIVAIWMHMTNGLYETDNIGNVAHWLTVGFLALFTLNQVVISFDFPRTTSLTLFFLIFTVLLGGYMLILNFPNLLPFLGQTINSIKPKANAQFYYIIAAVYALLFIIVKISVQFDYWEVRPNELLHHTGLLSDLKRFSAPSMRIDKEINDLFEYILLGSGRLIIQPSNERRAIVLDNVFFISHKERAITRMLGALQVQVRQDSN